MVSPQAFESMPPRHLMLF